MCWTIICWIFALSRAMWTIIRWIFALPTSLVPHIFYKFRDDIVGWMVAHVMDAVQNPRQVNNGQIILARDLEIRQDRENIYKWLVLEQDPRFNEALEALHVMELRIRARLNLRQLLPNENYSVHLIFKTTPNARGLDTFQEAILYEYDNPIPKDVCLERTTNTPNVGYIGFPVERNGWMELELGAFLRKPDHILGEVVVCLQETNVKDAKTGLIVAAIEVRPS